VGAEQNPEGQPGQPLCQQTEAATTQEIGTNSGKGSERYVELRLGVVIINTSLFTDGRVVPLGGQHISAALLSVYKFLGGKAQDANIPDEFKYVDAEILKHNTNRELCRLAAGEHQAHQKDVAMANTADIFTYLVQMAQEKQANQGTPFMNDNEIYHHCRSMGITKFVDKNGKELTEQQQVYPYNLTPVGRNLISITFPILRKPTWFSLGGPWHSGQAAALMILL
jgi:hypothetical protein